jgi:hypothetical protein
MIAKLAPCSCARFLTTTRAVAVGLMVLAAASSAGASTFTVGATPDCSSSSIPGALLLAALNGPSLDVIRIASDQSYTGQHVVISNQSVSLIGGYASCSDATGGGQTAVSGAGGSSNPVIEISGTVNGTRSVELVNLVISGGELGGVVISGANLVSIQGSLITGNQRGSGGGIHLDGTDGAVLTVAEDTAVIANSAVDPSGMGGGIRCTNGGTILLHGLVANNSAWFGGGVGLISCTMNDFAGGTLRGITGNTATFGGGIGAFNASVVTLHGSSSHPALVEGNTASVDGGGVYVSSSTVVARDSWIINNSAANRGAGVAVTDAGAFGAVRTLGSTCHTQDRCSRLSGNTVTGLPGHGGAILAELGSVVDIRQTYLEANHADFGSMAWVSDAGSQLLLEGDVIASNVGNDVIHQGSQSFVRAAFVTSDRNTADGGQVAFYTNGSDDTETRIFSSIILDPSVWGGGVNGATHVYDCLLVASNFGLQNPGTLVTVGNPLLRNPVAGDYHLDLGSPAIDYCDTFTYTPSNGDIDAEPRGTDLPAAPNGVGTYDLGADEWSEVASLLFGDGFETGTTAMWSSTTP